MTTPQPQTPSADKLRILLISRCPPYPLHLGDRLIVHHLARELKARGHIIDLLALDDGAAPPDPDAYRHLFRYQNIFPDPLRTPTDYLRRLLRPAERFPHDADEAWSPDLWRAIRKRMTLEQYDLVHFFGGVQVYEYANAVSPLRALITPYESYSLYLQSEIESGKGLQIGTRVRAWFAGEYEGWMFNPFRRTVVLTEADREELRYHNPFLPVEVIPNGVDLAAFTPQDTPREANTMVFTGNFAYPPNRDAAFFLIEEVLHRVQAKIPSAKLWLIGANPPDDLQEMADEDVVVSGQVPDMRDHLARATVFACPLRLGAGIKNKVLEALAMGCPVVGTPLSFEGIAVKQGESAVIAPPDADAFATALIHTLTDAKLRARLSANGRAVIEHGYQWSAVADRYEALYREVMES